MATVFSVEAVRRQEFPVPGAHAQVAREALEYLGRLSEECGGHLDALVYGSASRQGGSPNLRSDVDVVAVGDRLPGDQQRVYYELGQIAARHFVPMDRHLYSPAGLRNSGGAPYRDHVFADHLKLAQAESRHRIGDVTRHLRGLSDFYPGERAEIAEQVLERYLESKRHTLGLAMGDTGINVRAIECALGLGASLGRKVGALMQLTGRLEGDAKALLARQDAERVLEGLAREGARWTAALELTKLNRQYDLLLDDARTGAIGPDEYEYDLQQIQDEAYEHCFRLLAAAQHMLDRTSSHASHAVTGAEDATRGCRSLVYYTSM